MAYSTVPLVITGDSWTAGNNNTYVRDNFHAVYPDVFTSAGQIDYGTGSHMGSLLNLGASFQTLKVNSGGTYPEWQTRNNEGILCQGGMWVSKTQDWCSIYWRSSYNPIYNRGDFGYTSTDDENIYVPCDGIYQISGSVAFQIGVSTMGPVAVRLGPDNIEVLRASCKENGPYIISFCTTKRLSQNDSVTVDIYNPTYAGSFVCSPDYTDKTRLSILYLGSES